MHRHVRVAGLCVVGVALGCGPTLVGVFSSGGGSIKTTVVNPTLVLSGPAAFTNSTTAAFTATTTPDGQPLEAQLDSGDWQGVSGAFQFTGLAVGAHTVRARVVKAPASEQSVQWTIDTTAPTAPSGVAVAATTAGILRVTWTAGADAGSGLASYTIDYGTVTGGPYPGHATAAATATSVDLTGLSACQTYMVTVACTDRAGNVSSTTTEVSGRARCGGDGTFASTTVAVAGGTAALAQGDFNGDGILDLALAATNHLVIQLGNGSAGRGDGTFATAQTLDTGGLIQAIAVADLDQDQIPDLALVTSTHLRVYQGQGSGGVGTGQFALHWSTAASVSSPLDLVIHDVDADHIHDIVVANSGSNTLATFKGQGSGGRGDGTFAFLASVATGDRPGSLAVGDFNADGIADLAVACQNASDVLVTHLGNGSGGQGDGTFAARQTWLTGGFVGGQVLVGDFNSDGIDDMVVTLSLASIVCFMAGSGSNGIGTGSFYLDEVVSVGLRPWGLVAGEFTGDGITDYVAVSYLQQGATLIAANGSSGRGDGTFRTSTAGGVGARLFHAAAGDVDGNGSSDLVLADLDQGALVLRNNGRKGVGNGTFADHGTSPWVIGNGFGVGVGDFNNDGAPDFVVASFQQPWPGGSDWITVFAGDSTTGLGTGNFVQTQNPTTGAAPVAFAVGDFDRDRIQDLAVVCSDLDARGGGDRVDVLGGNGSSGVGSAVFNGGATVAVGATPRAIAVGDFNCDRILDLAVANTQAGTVTVLLGQGSGGRGNGQFTASSPIAVAAGPLAILAEDVNSDGILDLVVGTRASDSSGTITVLPGQGSNGRGNGAFAAGAVLATGLGVSGLVAGECTGDGIVDLVATHYRAGAGSGGITLFTGAGSGGRGNGTFTQGSELAVGGNALAIACGDFNHDHVLDLAVTITDAAEARVLPGQGSNGRGNGTFGTPVVVPLHVWSRAIHCVDLDSDGVPDLLAVGDGRVSLRFGGGSY